MTIKEIKILNFSNININNNYIYIYVFINNLHI